MSRLRSGVGRRAARPRRSAGGFVRARPRSSRRVETLDVADREHRASAARPAQSGRRPRRATRATGFSTSTVTPPDRNAPPIRGGGSVGAADEDGVDRPSSADGSRRRRSWRGARRRRGAAPYAGSTTPTSSTPGRREDAGVVPAQVPDADDGDAQCLARRRQGPLRLGHVAVSGEAGMAAAAGPRRRCPSRPRRHQRRRTVDDQGRAGVDRERRDAGGADGGQGRDADDGHVEADVLLRLGDLDDDRAGSRHAAPLAQRRRRSFHRLDGHDGAILHDDGLADVEAGDRVGRLSSPPQGYTLSEPRPMGPRRIVDLRGRRPALPRHSARCARGAAGAGQRETHPRSCRGVRNRYRLGRRGGTRGRRCEAGRGHPAVCCFRCWSRLLCDANHQHLGSPAHSPTDGTESAKTVLMC